MAYCTKWLDYDIKWHITIILPDDATIRLSLLFYTDEFTWPALCLQVFTILGLIRIRCITGVTKC